MAENKMFCFQCQETAKGTGCTIKGVCGKEATTSKWQDLLLSVVRGIGTIQHSIGKEPTPEVTRFRQCQRYLPVPSVRLVNRRLGA
jgi:hydroxylamine reductase